MKYIETVILENFQSHKNSVIEFDNQLNVIVGPSDSGKTAILRGIRWALYNEPSGDYFIREGENECSVTIKFSDGTKVKRYRSKNKNSYFLYDLDNNETKFEGFGVSVPQEIINSTGIKKILLDSDLSSAINLSDQLEGSFLLSERGSTRASSMGRLVGVNIIDDALRETLKDSRNLANNKKNIDENISQLQQELLEYNYLDKLSEQVNNLEKIRNKILLKSNIVLKYKDLYQKFSSIVQEKNKLKYYIIKLKDINILENTINNISTNINKYDYLNRHNHAIYKLSLNKKENIEIINVYKNINLVEIYINKIDSIYDLQVKLNKNNSKIKLIIIEINKLKTLTKSLQSISLVDFNIKTIKDNNDRLNNLKNIRTKQSSLRNSLFIGNKYVEQLQNIDKVSDMINKLQKYIFDINNLVKLYNKYNINNKDRDNVVALLNGYKVNIENQLIEYKQILIKQGTCPLCFSTIDNNKATHIISHYK